MTRKPTSQGKPSRQFTFICPSGRHQYIACVSDRLNARAALAGILLLVALSGRTLLGQRSEQSKAPSIEFAARIAQAVRVEHAPRLDGALDDPVWQQAIPITDFRQREPYEGQPATEYTEVRALYTRNEVYFGIVCHDSVANGPVATQLRRDVTQELDDYFEIVIDSRLARRNAYVFQINPLGTQRGALITDGRVRETQAGDPG